ncbi:MAG: putative component of transporter [Acidimicrobiaceae bacterium]|jgi:ABC-type sugar transport system substrate-binding protein|nr:putative component of transporter [Acidimicrobiaceae bacterium]
MFNQGKRSTVRFGKVAAPLVLTAGIVAFGTGAGATTVAGHRAAPAKAVATDLTHPTKALCKLKAYKIGYDVFSDSQPFAVQLSNGLKAAAKSVGCATIVETVDNMNGTTAIANIHTLFNEGINGFVDFQVLQAFQPAISKLLKGQKIPAVTVVGATLPGFPQVGLDPFNTEKAGATYMAQQEKKRFPGQIPYFVGGAEPASGAAVLARYKGAVAGIKSVFPGIPASHIIEVNTNGVDTTAYTNTLSALSAVPKSAVVMVQAVNDEDTGGMYKAVVARGFTKYLAEGYGGDSYGLNQVCLYPTHYVGDYDLNPAGWGPVLLSLVMMEMNGQKVPAVTNITGTEVTRTNPIAACKK